MSSNDKEVDNNINRIEADKNIKRIVGDEHEPARSPIFSFLSSSKSSSSSPSPIEPTPIEASPVEPSSPSIELKNTPNNVKVVSPLNVHIELKNDSKMPISAQGVKNIEPIDRNLTSLVSHGNYKLLDECPPGLSNNVKELAETPNLLVKRMLCDDEIILATFDVLFPFLKIPAWKIYYLLIITCGLYGIVLLYEYVQRWCYKRGCCTPPLVDFARGKMAITNKVYIYYCFLYF